MNPSQLNNAYALTAEEVLCRLNSRQTGLSFEEAQTYLLQHGPNVLPAASTPTFAQVFVRQFLNPLICVLLFVGTVALFMGEGGDAAFIYGVLIINAIIGSAQEYHAEESARALRQVVSTQTTVRRDGEEYDVDAQNIVPGDIVLLLAGAKVPADIRLLQTHSLEADESLLTGESMPVAKIADRVLSEDCTLGDRTNIAFAGTLITRGRATGIVIATALETELGRIARTVLGSAPQKTPLLIRMERFTKMVAYVVGIAALTIAAILILSGHSLAYALMFAVGLGVSAIPEGLPVALTVSLAIASRRMAVRNVLVRKLTAVEALGSCTYICTDKTGTLTMNELTVKKLLFPQQVPWEVTGSGIIPEGELILPCHITTQEWGMLVEPLCQVAVLCNEGFLGRRDNKWVAHGDSVDVALLVMAHKMGVNSASLTASYKKTGTIPFEPDLQYAASRHEGGGQTIISVKGAVERVLTMCGTMQTVSGTVALDPALLGKQAHMLANDGYRVVAFAWHADELDGEGPFHSEQLKGLTFLGLVGIIDPLRPEAKAAVIASLNAGISVVMVTGDHPLTALAIARELELAKEKDEVVTGDNLRNTAGDKELDDLVRRAKVFARIEPQQKLQIVTSLKRQNHFVAVTGDGVNDAPALKTAHVGVAMGKGGTDVARETADLIITDDRFSSLVAGIEEGRVAYANIRKVVYLLVATGAAEIVLITFSVAFGLPLPLTAIQLLWLNLVTNGIQDVALAFEAPEGDELRYPPRLPDEPIFNKIMIEQVAISALVIGLVSFLNFKGLIESGRSYAEAQNSTLLLMVLFENIMIANCRSETKSAFSISPLKNPLLISGTIVAQLVHIAAMHMVMFNNVLGVAPVMFSEWQRLLLLALSVLLVMEVFKYFKRRFNEDQNTKSVFR